MGVGDANVFPGFPTPVLTQLFFPKPRIPFLTCFCRGERRKYAGKKSLFNRGSNHNHQVMSLTRLLLSHPDRAISPSKTCDPGVGQNLSLIASDKKIFKDFNFFFILMPWQPEFLKVSNSLKKFWRRPFQEHFCEISSKSNKKFQRRRCLKKKLTHGWTDTLMHGRMDGVTWTQWTTDHDISSLAYSQWS